MTSLVGIMTKARPECLPADDGKLRVPLFERTTINMQSLDSDYYPVLFHKSIPSQKRCICLRSGRFNIASSLNVKRDACCETRDVAEMLY